MLSIFYNFPFVNAAADSPKSTEAPLLSPNKPCLRSIKTP